MIIDRDLLALYLRQRQELGEREIFLDSLTALEAVQLIAGKLTRHASPAVDTSTLQGLPVIQHAAGSCTACALHATRTTVVFGEGNPNARVVVVGEAPGAEEDRTGRPFVGAAGRLLDLLLQTSGFARGDVYICNVLKCRPPENRNPLPEEVEACSGFLRRQLAEIRPAVLVALGNFAAKTLLGTETGITKLRRQIHRFEEIPLVATFHPAYLLRSPQYARAAWQDFQLVRQVLNEQA